MQLTLHGYWRSSAAYRVRIALNLKGLDYHQVTYDLRTGEHHQAAYRELAPQGLVPAMEAGGAVLFQSPAILEWIEERWPEPALLPADLHDRAIVRSMSALIGCDIHPLNNLRVLNAVTELHGSTEANDRWIARWITEGFTALEVLISRYGSGFAFGDRPTLADCYLLPQVYSAERFEVDLTSYPRLIAAARAAGEIPEVRAAHPSLQPDAP